HAGLEPPWEVPYEAGLGDVDRAFQLRVRNDGAAHHKVFVDRGREQDRIFESESDMGTQGSEKDVPNVDAVEKDAALADVVQARDEIGERGLAAARASDEAHRLARLDDEVEVAQHPLVRFRVLETDAAELDAAATRVQPPRLRTVGDLGARVEDLVQALRRGAALLAHRQHPSDGVHRPDEHEDVAHERHKPADSEPALDDVDTPQKKHRDERQVGQEVQLGPDLGAGFDTLEAGLSDHARLAFETLLEQRHPTE